MATHGMTARRRGWSRLVAGGALVALSLAPGARVFAQQGPSFTPSANVSVYATGFNDPRGLRFGLDGNLYVAEAGTGGTRDTSTATMATYGPCQHGAPAPGGGDWLGGYTARISMVDSKGTRTTVVDNLPSTVAQNNKGFVEGVSDVEFVHGVLYGLLTGAGCFNGNRDVPNGIIQVANDGSWSIYNLSTFAQAHPGKPDDEDFNPEGSWFSLTTDGDNLYTINPNVGQLAKLAPLSGQMTEVTDTSLTLGHIVPTAITWHNGNLYVANLGLFPIAPGTENVYQITPAGQITTYAKGLTAASGLAFDSSGTLYATELSTANNGPTPGNGAVVRLTSGGTWQTVASGLVFPIGLTIGSDGMLYVSNYSFGFPAGAGQVVKINPTAAM